MDILRKRWIYIIGGFGVCLFLGCGLAWSVFVVPIESVFNWTRDQTSLAFTMNILCFSLGSILAGVLSSRLSYASLVKLAGGLIFTGFFLTSFISLPWHLYLTYGLLCGTGIGLGYNCVLSVCPLWLPEKSGTATGILLMGYALSTAIFGPLLNSLIGMIGIFNTFRVLAIVCGLGVGIGSFLIRRPNIAENDQLPKIKRNKKAQSEDVNTANMIKKPIFWIYYIITILFAGSGMVIVNHCSPILTEGLMTTAGFAAIVVSVTSISNGVGRFCWGIVYDKIGVIKSLIIICSIAVISSLGLFIAFSYQAVMLFVVSACLLMLTYAGNAVTIPSIVRSLFGQKYFSLNYSVMGTDAIFTSFFPSIAGMLQVATQGYRVPLLMIVVVCLTSIITLVFFNRLYQNNSTNKNNNELISDM